MALNFKWEKHHTILTAIGGLVTLVLGYLIWRHENNVQQQETAQNTAAQNAALQQYEQSLANSTQSVPQLYGETSVPEEGDVGSGSSEADSGLAEILKAFFPGGTTSSPTDSNPSSGSGSSSTTNPTSPTNPVPPSSAYQPIYTGPEPIAHVPLPTTSSPVSVPSVPTGGPVQHVGKVV